MSITFFIIGIMLAVIFTIVFLAFCIYDDMIDDASYAIPGIMFIWIILPFAWPIVLFIGVIAAFTCMIYYSLNYIIKSIKK